MGNKHSAIYDDILSEFETNSNLAVIQSSCNKSARVYSKITLNNPSKVTTIWNNKDGKVTCMSINSTSELIFNKLKEQIENEKNIIEYFSGKGSLNYNNILQQIYTDLHLIPSFDTEAEGLYEVVYTFQPCISMRPGSYKLLYHLVSKKSKIENSQDMSLFHVTTPTADIYGKI